MNAINTIGSVRTFVVENFLYGEDSDFDTNTSFLDSGIIDSTGILELIAFLETEFGITVADDDLLPENFDTLNNIDTYLKKKLNGT